MLDLSMVLLGYAQVFKDFGSVCFETRWRRADIFDPPVVRDHPVSDAQDPVCQTKGLLNVMRDEEDRGLVPTTKLEEQTLHPDPGQRVEGAERLISENEFRPADE